MQVFKFLSFAGSFILIYYTLHGRLKIAQTPKDKKFYTASAIASLLWLVLQIAALHFDWKF